MSTYPPLDAICVMTGGSHMVMFFDHFWEYFWFLCRIRTANLDEYTLVNLAP